MNITILKMLRADAKAWWYHRQCRERGQIAEARERERRSIRSNVEMIRKVRADPDAHVFARHHGTSIYYTAGENSTCSRSSYAMLEKDAAAMVCIMLGTPCIDTRLMSLTDRINAIALPMVAVNRKPDDWISGSAYRPLREVAAYYRHAGAVLYNLDDVEPRPFIEVKGRPLDPVATAMVEQWFGGNTELARKAGFE